MDFSRRSVNVEQISSDSVEEYALDKNAKLHDISNQTICAPEDVICPEPRRLAPAPCIMENLNRFWCRSKWLLMQKGHFLGLSSGLEILDNLLSNGEPEDDSDRSNHLDFFCSSPPVRVNNPLVHDMRFGGQVIPLPLRLLGECFLQGQRN